MNNLVLSAVQLCKCFKESNRPVIDQLNLEIREGEVLALAGKSGSGKTTLLRILAGLEQLDSGVIYFKGEKVKGPADKLIAGHSHIRLVHQHFELAHRMTVAENIAQKLRHLHPLEQSERVLELIEVCRLGHLATQYVEELSGGEKQRLSLARTLAEEPELLLLDEPFSNLDPHLKESIKEDLFRFVRAKGLTIVIVSHDPRDALSIADTICVLEEGRVVQKGNPEEVYYSPLTPQIAELLGKVNICEAAKLLPHLSGKLKKIVNEVPQNSLIGFRPELITPADEGEADFEAVVQEILFQGAHKEARILIGNTIKFSAQLRAFSPVSEGDLLPFKIHPDHIQLWGNGNTDAGSPVPD